MTFKLKYFLHKSGFKYTHFSSHHPCSRSPGYRSMALIHPTVPWQQTLQDISHDHDYCNPQASAHQHSSDYLLSVCRQIPTVDRDKDSSDRNECHTAAVAHIQTIYKEKHESSHHIQRTLYMILNFFTNRKLKSALRKIFSLDLCGTAFCRS